MNMKTILVPTEQHDLMTSILQSALLLARKFDSYIEGFALFPAMVELYALNSAAPLPIEVKEHDAEMAKQARSFFSSPAIFSETACYPSPSLLPPRVAAPVR